MVEPLENLFRPKESRILMPVDQKNEYVSKQQVTQHKSLPKRGKFNVSVVNHRLKEQKIGQLRRSVLDLHKIRNVSSSLEIGPAPAHGSRQVGALHLKTEEDEQVIYPLKIPQQVPQKGNVISSKSIRKLRALQYQPKA